MSETTTNPQTPAPAEAAQNPTPAPPAPDAPKVDQPATGEPANEPLGEGGKKALEAERSARKAAEDAAKDYKTKLDEIERAKLSDLEKAQKDAADAATKLAQYEATTLRQQVALDKGIPATLVGRLQGSTKEELAADADALLALIKAPTSPAPDPGQGPRPVNPQGEEDAEYAKYFPEDKRK